MPKRAAKPPPEENRFWDWLFYALVVLIVVVAIIFVPWRDIFELLSDIAENVWELFFWGLFLVIFAVLTPILLIWRKRFSLFLTYWYRWLGIIVLTLAIWGIFAFNGVGGTIGMAIIGGETDAWGVFRIVMLFILSIMLIFPRAVLALSKAMLKFMSDYRARRKQRAATRPIVVHKMAKQKEIDFTPEPEKQEVKEKKAAKPKVEEPVPSGTRGLKQIAQDVWKKYGQAPGTKVIDGWRLPPIDILDEAGDIEYGQPDNVQRARRIEEALKSYGVDSKVVQINAGPTVTQFGVEPGWDIKTREIRERDKDGTIATHLEEVSRTRVKVDRITSLANDLALALAAPSIRIEAPVPGKSIIGIEVPNTVSGVVSLRGVIETSVFQKLAAKSKLAIALGKGAGGEAGAADLARMPHLLIAGATGSGKTVCLNASICCLLMQNTPDDLRFIMIDPKRVELTMFNSIPHLAAPVIVNAEKALEALRWLELEMDNRYQLLAKAGARNIDGFNKDKRGKEKMYYMVLIIDELADLMMTGYDEVERILCRLAQLSRAVGIHLIVATQRPSVDVVTGLIKANFPTRLSFAVTSQVDSRTILDTVGAEKLLGRGDMLYAPTEAAKPKRLQGCYVSDAETERLVYFWGSQKEEQVTEIKIESVPGTVPGIHAPPKDVLMEQARKLVQDQEQISASFLQRKLQIGYPRAARLKELLDEERAQAMPKLEPVEDQEADSENS
jgi:S-DNA-T family DNA segregation ATPase FtsK/SpoIIIE